MVIYHNIYEYVLGAEPSAPYFFVSASPVYLGLNAIQLDQLFKYAQDILPSGCLA
jgi:hypothetical protein